MNLRQENKLLKEQLMKYKNTLRVPLCEICGELIVGREDRLVIKLQTTKDGWRESVVEHMHQVCWDGIKKNFKYKF